MAKRSTMPWSPGAGGEAVVRSAVVQPFDPQPVLRGQDIGHGHAAVGPRCERSSARPLATSRRPEKPYHPPASRACPTCRSARSSAWSSACPPDASPAPARRRVSRGGGWAGNPPGRTVTLCENALHLVVIFRARLCQCFRPGGWPVEAWSTIRYSKGTARSLPARKSRDRGDRICTIPCGSYPA